MKEFNTTRQDYIFPIQRAYARSTGRDIDFEAHLRQQLIFIQDDLLYGLITPLCQTTCRVCFLNKLCPDLGCCGGI
uniref:hypothetical protein n=1 Tax=Massilia sp. TSP1-1-2 TaxID=2804649 RepID=UPI003CEED3F7